MLAVLMTFSGAAMAFCGTYVSSYDSLENTTSEVAIVRQAMRTTLTVASDVVGDARDFAMVIPVPLVLPEDAIHVIDSAVFDRLRGYSDPREVSYDCADFAPEEADADADSDADSDADGDADSDVQIEAQYVVGEYDVTILSADESSALVDWLQGSGYAVPDASAELLGEYITGGSYFFAAQVREDAAIASGQTLSPLQFSYPSESFGLPIRIGTLNSPGEQNVAIYAFTDYDDGRVGISNYPEVEVDHDCMWPSDGEESFTQYYDRVTTEAHASQSDASWITEYAWGQGSCDPCTGVVPTSEDVVTLGYQPDYHYGMYYYFTRLAMRYTPEQATRDLTLYTSGLQENQQMRFIQYDHDLEDRFEVCGEGWVESPGSCDDEWGVNAVSGLDGEAGDDGAGGGCGCGTAPAGRAALAVALGVIAMVGYRRRLAGE